MGDKMNKKGEVEWDTFIPFVIALGVLVLSFILYIVISGNGTDMIASIKNFLRFGG